MGRNPGEEALVSTGLHGGRLLVAQVESESLCLGTDGAVFGDLPAPIPTLPPRDAGAGSFPSLLEEPCFPAPEHVVVTAVVTSVHPFTRSAASSWTTHLLTYGCVRTQKECHTGLCPLRERDVGMNHHMRGQRVAGVSSMDSRVLGVPGEGWPRAGCWGWGALSRWENVLGRGTLRVEGWWWGHAMPFGGVPKPGSQGRAWSPMTDGP